MPEIKNPYTTSYGDYTNYAAFAGRVADHNLPWAVTNRPWTDSMKEQYFSLLNADIANQHELDMWRLNNEYNTPEKQMERLVAAGINPAAAYQQVNSGNASSAPGTHVSNTPAWHDTQDKIAKVNAIISGIRDIMSTVGSGISAAQDVQSMALTQQNNWYDQMRRNVALNGFVPLGSEEQVREAAPGTMPIRIGKDLYMSSRDAMLFPEFFKAMSLSKQWSDYDIAAAARSDQHSLVERRNRIDQLMQKIFDGFENNASSDQMLKWFLQLIAYGLQQRIGGGF